VKVKQLRGGKTAFVVTKWLDLGHSETPQDPKWRRHLHRTYRAYQCITEKDASDGIGTRLEQAEGKSLEMLFETNASSLRDGLYRKIHHPCIWALWISETDSSAAARVCVSKSVSSTSRSIILPLIMFLSIAIAVLLYARCRVDLEVI